MPSSSTTRIILLILTHIWRCGLQVWCRHSPTKALAIYRCDGLGAWGAYHDGRYRSYLMDAQTAAAPSTSIIPDSLITPENAKIYIARAIGARLALKILRD